MMVSYIVRVAEVSKCVVPHNIVHVLHLNSKFYQIYTH